MHALLESEVMQQIEADNSDPSKELNRKESYEIDVYGREEETTDFDDNDGNCLPNHQLASQSLAN
ncbi:hypothetical protein SCA6_013370 [Theobroma cacao]